MKKDSWHYQIRRFFALFIKIQKGKEIDIDYKVTRFEYVGEVIIGMVCFVVIPLSILITNIFDKIGIAKPINDWLVRNFYSKKKKYIKFV